MKENDTVSTPVKSERIVYLDALRVVSAFAVMVIHLAAKGYKEAIPGSYEWVVCRIYNGIPRFAVPVFVMISGAMYLNPQRSISMGDMLRKAAKLMGIFFFWSTLYALAESARTHVLFTPAYFQSAAQKIATGHYHMWYLYMIAGLYLATPFLRPIAADKRLLQWFLLIAFVLNHCLRLLSEIPGLEEIARTVAGSADLHLFCGYAGYYCLGYYLHQMKVTPKKIGTLCAASVALFTIVLALSYLAQKPNIVFQEKMPHIVVYSAMVFLLFKQHAEHLAHHSGIKSLIGKIAPCTLGMYLLHPAFNLILRKAGLYALTFNPLFCTILCSALVFVLSFAATALLKRTPLVRIFL